MKEKKTRITMTKDTLRTRCQNCTKARTFFDIRHSKMSHKCVQSRKNNQNTVWYDRRFAPKHWQASCQFNL